MRWVIVLLLAGCSAEVVEDVVPEVVEPVQSRQRPDENVGPDPKDFDYVAETGEINPVENIIPLDEWCREGEKWHYLFGEKTIIVPHEGPATYEGEEYCKGVDEDTTYYFNYGDKEIWIIGDEVIHIVEGKIV